MQVDADLTALSSWNDPGGSGVASCVGDVASGTAVSTSLPAPHTLTVTATDNAGNTSTSRVNYVVEFHDADSDGIADTSDGVPADAGPGAQRLPAQPDDHLAREPARRDPGRPRPQLRRLPRRLSVSSTGAWPAARSWRRRHRLRPAGHPGGLRGAVAHPGRRCARAAVTGTGTATDPFQIVTEVAAGTTGVHLVADRHVRRRRVVHRRRPCGSRTRRSAARAIRVWRAADCYFQGSDRGYGTFVSATSAVGCRRACCRRPGGRSGPARSSSGRRRLGRGTGTTRPATARCGARSAPRQGFDDTCRCAEYIDNGAGSVVGPRPCLPPGALTGSHRLNVLERAVQQGEMPGDADVDGVADASTTASACSTRSSRTRTATVRGDACAVPRRRRPAVRRSADHLGARPSRGTTRAPTSPATWSPTGWRSRTATRARCRHGPRTFTRTNLTPGSSWTYFVRACNGPYCSDWSNAVTVTQPAAATARGADRARRPRRRRTAASPCGGPTTATTRPGFMVAYGVAGSNTYAFVNVGAAVRGPTP